MSHVTCNFLSSFSFFDGGASLWRVCYHRGLLRLVYSQLNIVLGNFFVSLSSYKIHSRHFPVTLCYFPDAFLLLFRILPSGFLVLFCYFTSKFPVLSFWFPVNFLLFSWYFPNRRILIYWLILLIKMFSFFCFHKQVIYDLSYSQVCRGGFIIYIRGLKSNQVTYKVFSQIILPSSESTSCFLGA